MWQKLKLLAERRYGIPIRLDQSSLITPLYQSGTIMRYDIAENIWCTMIESSTKFADGGNEDSVPCAFDIKCCRLFTVRRERHLFELFEVNLKTKQCKKLHLINHLDFADAHISMIAISKKIHIFIIQFARMEFSPFLKLNKDPPRFHHIIYNTNTNTY